MRLKINQRKNKAHSSALLKKCLKNIRLLIDKKKQDSLSGNFFYDLESGENPYQIPASVFISDTEDDSLSLLNFKQVSGDVPCFTNMADADCILRTICLIAEGFMLNTGSIPYLCIVAKHGNACGVGISKESPSIAIEKALFGNPQAIWGGEAITNFPIDKHLATIFFRSERRERLFGNGFWMLDLVMAPFFDKDALLILGKSKKRKLFENRNLCLPLLKESGFVYRTIRGGFLKQPSANYILNLQACQLGGHDFSESEISSLIAAWAVAFSSNHGGNEVVLVKDGALLSAGGGPSTVEATRVAVARATECGHDAKGAAFAADAFFPFTDAPSMLCNAGITIGCVPEGGKRNLEVKNFFGKNKMNIIYLPQEIRGFCRH